ncbi:hypothetical protein [Rhodococcus pyridinivorans]|uniref:hypothetical protein n=1 Tax=Rhodococcus pyridinivorans TaxID=103816 RepID=UPI001E29CCF6|nr:hypothetical protein [Rhodococcus pyridinivorans]
MTIHFSAVGLAVADLDRSFACYRMLGLDLPIEAPEVPPSDDAVSCRSSRGSRRLP